MHIEARLESIDTTMKAILVALQSGASFAAIAGAPAAAAEAAEKKTTRSKKTEEKAADEPVLDGDALGTTYYIGGDAQNLFMSVPPGQAAPTGVPNLNKVSAAFYLAKKTEAEKSNAAAAPQQPAATAPTATAPAAAASSSDGTTFKQVVEALTALSKDTREGLGRAGVMAILNQFLPDMAEADRKVPKLEALGKNGDILAAVNALMNPAAAGEVDLF